MLRLGERTHARLADAVLREGDGFDAREHSAAHEVGKLGRLVVALLGPVVSLGAKFGVVVVLLVAYRGLQTGRS